MFNSSLKGGADNGIYYLERIISIIINLFQSLFGISSSDDDVVADDDAGNDAE